MMQNTKKITLALLLSISAMPSLLLAGMEDLNWGKLRGALGKTFVVKEVANKTHDGIWGNSGSCLVPNLVTDAGKKLEIAIDGSAMAATSYDSVLEFNKAGLPFVTENFDLNAFSNGIQKLSLAKRSGTSLHDNVFGKSGICTVATPLQATLQHVGYAVDIANLLVLVRMLVSDYDQAGVNVDLLESIVNSGLNYVDGLDITGAKAEVARVEAETARVAAEKVAEEAAKAEIARVETERVAELSGLKKDKLVAEAAAAKANAKAAELKVANTEANAKVEAAEEAAAEANAKAAAATSELAALKSQNTSRAGRRS